MIEKNLTECQCNYINSPSPKITPKVFISQVTSYDPQHQSYMNL